MDAPARQRGLSSLDIAYARSPISTYSTFVLNPRFNPIPSCDGWSEPAIATKNLQ